MVTLRMRLSCEVWRKGSRQPEQVVEVLNEMVIDRGSSAFLTNIECYEKGRFISRVQADGIMLATPTGGCCGCGAKPRGLEPPPPAAAAILVAHVPASIGCSAMPRCLHASVSQCAYLVVVRGRHAGLRLSIGVVFQPPPPHPPAPQRSPYP